MPWRVGKTGSVYRVKGKKKPARKTYKTKTAAKNAKGRRGGGRRKRRKR